MLFCYAFLNLFLVFSMNLSPLKYASSEFKEDVKQGVDAALRVVAVTGLSAGVMSIANEFFLSQTSGLDNVRNMAVSFIAVTGWRHLLGARINFIPALTTALIAGEIATRISPHIAIVGTTMTIAAIVASILYASIERRFPSDSAPKNVLKTQ